MNDWPEPPLPVVTNSPPWLSAYGDETQLLVLRSVALQETDELHRPVDEHLARHDLVLADVATMPAPEMMFGVAQVSWYMNRRALRDGLSSHGSSDAARQKIWDER
jgi:hypothetical protein